MRILPCGDSAVLVDCESLDEAQGWFSALHEQTDVVLGARSELLRGEPGHLRALLSRTSPVDTAGRPRRSPSRCP